MDEIEGQGSLLEQAKRRATEGERRAASHESEEALRYWTGLVWEVARKYQTFSTNAVVEFFGKLGNDDMKLNEPRSMGTVMRRAVRLGIIEPTQMYEPDTTSMGHGRPKRVWHSLVYRGGQLG